MGYMKAYLFIVLTVLIACGYTKRDGYIKGGAKANYDKAMVYITTTNPPSFCTGVFISSAAIITCAKCVDGKNPSEITVKWGIGEYDKGIQIPIERISSATENDIVVLIVKSGQRKKEASIYKFPCRKKDVPKDLEPTTIIGWGLTSVDVADPKYLYLVEQLWNVAIENCKTEFPYPNAKWKKYVCMKAILGTQATCYGDCGAAVVKGDRLVGLVIKNPQDCEGGKYTLVASIQAAMPELFKQEFAGCNMASHKETITTSDGGKTPFEKPPVNFPSTSCKHKMCIKWKTRSTDQTCNAKKTTESKPRDCTEKAVQKLGFSYSKMSGTCDASKLLGCPCCKKYKLKWNCYKCEF